MTESVTHETSRSAGVAEASHRSKALTSPLGCINQVLEGCLGFGPSTGLETAI